MRFLIDIGHPAHVHYFKNLIFKLKNNGHLVIVTVKDIPAATQLLGIYKIPYILTGKRKDSVIGKIVIQFYTVFRIVQIAKVNKIDIMLGVSINIAHARIFLNKPAFFFDDDDDNVVPIMAKFGHPFADFVVSPDVLYGKRKKKETIYYPGYQELAYLHPKQFTPDPEVLSELGIKPDEKYFVLRFNVFKAHHDIGNRGLSLDQKMKLINELKLHGRIFITTERNIEPELEEYKLRVSPEKIHSLMFYATMFLGDSQTMTSEAAVLGVPSFRCNSFAGRISYLEEEERRYGLTYAYQPEDFDKLLSKLKELLLMPDLKLEWQIRRKKMLDDKIDVTSFWQWYFEDYPHNKFLVKNTSGFWEQFK